MRLRIDERQANEVLLLLQAGLCVIAAIAVPILHLGTLILVVALIGLAGYTGLWLAYRRGWIWARYAAVIMTTALVVLAISLDPDARAAFSPIFFLPLVFALIFLGPWGTLLTGITLLAITAITVPPPSPYFAPLHLAVILTCIAGMALARAVHDTMRLRTEEAAAEARAALELAETRAELATAQANELADRAEQQRHLLGLVADLETPAVALQDGVLLAPVIGALDSRRAASIGQRLLKSVSEQRAQLLIIDLAGISMMDTQVARSLVTIVSSIRLLGCQVVITSISAQDAMTMTQIGVALDVTTARSPQEALNRHLLTTGARYRQN